MLGGGPAGTLTAALLASCDINVCLLDRKSATAKLPEVVAPWANNTLHSWREIGLDFSKLGTFRRCYGIRRLWGSDVPEYVDFLRAPGGDGWIVDRQSTDARLLEHLAHLGARVERDAANICVARRGESWYLRWVDTKGSDQVAHAQLLVDATGRPACFARRQGSERVVQRRLIATCGIVEVPVLSSTEGAAPNWLHVESLPVGWAYGLRYPLESSDGLSRSVLALAIVSLSADAKKIRKGWERARLESLFQAGETPLKKIARTMQHYGPPTPRMFDASSVRLHKAFGPGWLAIGDAAASYDPISSQGFVHALASAPAAAYALRESLNGNDSALGAFSIANTATWQRTECLKPAVYAQEKRWPDLPFWSKSRSHPETNESFSISSI